jgi:hypothetical protein
MTTVPYIILQDSSGSGGQFAVVQGYYKPILERNQTVNKTVAGSVDIAQGGIYEKHEYMLRCRESEDRSGYGTVQELERLWRLNNPNGDPTDKITFIDHFSNTLTVVFVGEFSRNAITTILSGSGAWFFVPVILMEVPT